MTTPSATTPPAYAALEARFARAARVGEALGVLSWDQATMMPPGGAESRGDQIATLKAIRHGMLTAPEVADGLAAAADEDLDPWQAANISEMRRAWTHATALDEALVTALSKAETACETVWRQARPAADFAPIVQPLDSLLGLVREAAAAKGERLGLAPYDALMDQYEPHMGATRVDALFAALESALPDLLARFLETQARRPPPARPAGAYPADIQHALAVRVMERLGFDFQSGRLDVSLHPFCGGTPEDTRLTTRFDEADPVSSLMAVLHETGHALYERGLPKAWRGQPVGRARSMGVHESQSLTVEMQVGRSAPFLATLAPLVAEVLGDDPAFAADNLHRLCTRVEASFIRVDADEATYPLHVILRYRLERDMVAGRLAPRDLPEAWNEGMATLLGLAVPDDRLGCLQDLHWYDGAWGYFPTYTIGALNAAQLCQAAVSADAAIADGMARGDPAPLLDWLGRNVHARASSVTADSLIEEATGRPLGTDAFLDHLKRRYLDAA